MNEALDRLVVTEHGRVIELSPDRDKLVPSAVYFGYDPPKRKQKHKREGAER